MLAVVVEYLHSLWKVRIGRKIRGTYAFEFLQKLKVCVRIAPQTGELIIIHEKVKPFIVWLFTRFRIIKADKVLYLATLRLKIGCVKCTRTAEYALVKVFIIASLSVYLTHPLSHNTI